MITERNRRRVKAARLLVGSGMDRGLAKKLIGYPELVSVRVEESSTNGVRSVAIQSSKKRVDVDANYNVPKEQIRGIDPSESDSKIVAEFTRAVSGNWSSSPLRIQVKYSDSSQESKVIGIDRTGDATSPTVPVAEVDDLPPPPNWGNI